jgi:uncharacterized protein (TIGR02147 family)
VKRKDPNPRDTVVVFDYLDVRAFLRDTYEARNAAGRPFSYRAFSMRAGLRSPNHLKRVIDGERELTTEMAVRYAAALGLEGDAARYFGDLAAFARARTSDEKNAAYQRLGVFRGYRRAQRLEMAHADYHANWYVPAVRELALRPDFQPDAGWICARLVPPIRKPEAEQALDTLFALGLLQRGPAGAVTQGEAVVTTGPETQGLHIGNYHRAMMARAAAAIDLVPAGARDISSLTFCVGAAPLAEIKERIRRFRQEIIALASEETAGDQVAQLNLQLFPLSTSRAAEPGSSEKP